MVDLTLKILQKYWGHQNFRPLQRDIISSVNEKNDTLAILPTGGGKSVCFQIPAMMQEGICIVISPLIALMKDQVVNLQKKGINAIAVHSGMTTHEVDIAMDNAIFGNYKFLYLSPERLKSEIFRTRAPKMNISFIVVDEAHCISQWGYDFRPEYLKIKNIYEFTGRKPVIALTATATPEVRKDIIEQLDLKSPNVIAGNFERENISYIVRNTEDKNGTLLKLARSARGSGIVYVRERKKSEEIASFLSSQSISADSYHAGFSSKDRSKKQDEWMNGSVSVIVATNAFGMGIDKNNVRFVCHFDIPESIEAYYQEAGRAGRDSKRSYAVLLWNNHDIKRLKRISALTFPDLEYLADIYQKLYRFHEVAYGDGLDTVYRFNLEEFSRKFKLHAPSAYYAVKYLESDGFVTLTDELNNPSRITFIISREELYMIQLKNESLDAFIKVLLRVYQGIFSEFVAIDEDFLARATRNSKASVVSMLLRLSRMGVIKYIPGARSPLMIFHHERLDEKGFKINSSNYKNKVESFEKRINAVISYASLDDGCRSGFLVQYFGQKEWVNCGTCDLCIKRKNSLDKILFEKETEHKIKLILEKSPKNINELSILLGYSLEGYKDILRKMADKGDIFIKGEIVTLNR